jgi:hypothetical protein
MANRLKDLAEGLATFYRDLGDRVEDVVLITLSEFGRTARENGNRGTDHGHANVMFALGGPVRGGKVYGRWPGLAPEVLYEGRDLNLTTDFRTVCSEVISRHLGQKDLSKIFPGFRSAPALLNECGWLGLAGFEERAAVGSLSVLESILQIIKVRVQPALRKRSWCVPCSHISPIESLPCRRS